MKTKKQIKERRARIQAYVDSVTKEALLIETERIAFTGSKAALEIIDWVLADSEDQA